MREGKVKVNMTKWKIIGQTKERKEKVKMRKWKVKVETYTGCFLGICSFVQHYAILSTRSLRVPLRTD